MAGEGRGFVSLVGAGPGDPDLLTLRALERLKAADVVLFDDLASNAAILALAPPTAELIGVGKRAGRPSPKQEEVSRQIVAEAMKGRRVVRLKSGDPTVFGRADEEMAAVRAAGIPFEIVPGVTTATAAVAAAGFSLTKRLVARRVQFVTGHDVDGRLPGDLHLAALADPGSTTCVFMGKATFPALVERLIGEGLPAETPAIIAHGLGTEAAETIEGTVIGIAARLRDDPPPGPCMILYGFALARE